MHNKLFIRSVRVIAFCIVLIVGLYIGSMFVLHESRVVMACQLSAVSLDGEPIALSIGDVTIRNTKYSRVRAYLCSPGEILIPETFAWVTNEGIGDPCYWTYIEVHPRGFHACETRVGVCTGGIIPSKSTYVSKIEFRLSPETSSQPSTAVHSDQW